MNVTFSPSQWIKRRENFSQTDVGCRWRGCLGAHSYCWELRHLASQVSPSKGTSKALNPNYLDFTFLASSLAGRKGGFIRLSNQPPIFQCWHSLGGWWHASQCSFDYRVHTVAELGGVFASPFFSFQFALNTILLPSQGRRGLAEGPECFSEKTNETSRNYEAGQQNQRGLQAGSLGRERCLWNFKS